VLLPLRIYPRKRDDSCCKRYMKKLYNLSEIYGLSYAK